MKIRSPQEAHEIRRIIVSAVGRSADRELRWVVEAIIELCVTVEESSFRLERAINGVASATGGE